MFLVVLILYLMSCAFVFALLTAFDVPEYEVLQIVVAIFWPLLLPSLLMYKGAFKLVNRLKVKN